MHPILSARDQRLVLAIIAVAVFMASLDSTIVNISLPGIAESFGADIGLVSWVVLAYLLTLAGFLLILGRLADLHGFRRVFIIGFAIFTIGSLACGLSTTIGHLIAFRAVQGLGGAALDALAPAMIVLYLPKASRGRVIGVLATVVSLGIAAGPILGGFITEYTSWHWIFFINVPIGIAAVVVASWLLPKDPPVTERGRFDYAGSVLIIAALVSMLYPLNRGLEFGWTSPIIVGSFCVSLCCWVLFVRHEQRSASPLVDMQLFASKNFVLGNIAGMMLMLVDCGTLFLMPFFLENVKGISVEIAGLLLAVPAISLMVVGPFAGGLSDRCGSRTITTLAALLAAVTLFLIAGFDVTTGFPYIIATLALLGIALGLFFPPNMSRILGSGCKATSGGEGVASSTMMTIRNVGAVIGVALFGTIAVYVIEETMAVLGTQHLTPDIMVTGFSAAFLWGAVI
jgi:EmrB/QacA subfamily drug resistance transporter